MSAGGHVAIQDIERLSGVSRLEQWAGVGGTLLRLRTILDSGLVAAGAWAVIAPYTAQCEVRAISSYENRDLTVAALTYAHDPDTAVLITTEPVLNARWFGGETAASINLAVTAIDTLGGGVVRIPKGTWLQSTTEQIQIPDGVHLKGDGFTETIIDARGTVTPIVGTEKWNGSQLRDFGVTHASNTAGSGLDLIDAAYGANSCLFENIRLVGKATVTVNGFRIRGAAGGTGAGTDSHNNAFINLQTTSSSEITGKAMFFDGDNTNAMRLNANRFYSGRLDGYTTGMYLWGNGNYISGVTFNGPCTGEAAIHIKGDGSTADNVIIGNYFDGAITGDTVKLEYDDASNVRVMAIIGPNLGALSTDVSVVANGNEDRVRWGLWNGRELRLGGIVGNDFDHNSQTKIGTVRDDEALKIQGGLSNTSGAYLLLGGIDFTGGGNALSDDGGISAVIGTGADAEFRVSKSADHSSNTPLLNIDVNGRIQPQAGGYVKRARTIAAATGTLQADVDGYEIFRYKLAGNLIIQTAGTTAAIGSRITFRLEQAASGGPHTVTFDTTYFKVAGGAYTMTSTAAKVDYLSFEYNGTKWEEASRVQNV